MRRLAVLVIAILAPTVLAACGGTEGSALAVLTAAPDAAQQAGTARFEMDVTTSSDSLPGGEMSMSGTGAADYPDRLHMNITMSGAPQISGDMEMTLDGTLMHLRMTAFEQMLPEGKRWISVNLEDVGDELGFDVSQLLQSGQNDPTAWLETLRGASGDIEEVGTEEVRGVQTTHYRVLVDTDKAFEQMEEATNEDLTALLEQSGMPDTYAAEVWVGDDGLARRVTFDLEMSPQGVGTMEQQMTMEFFDYGADVEIPIPPESETIDLQQLMDQAGGSP